ncbi:Ser/Thr protein kinase RdoA involved in Cpx stress response, MazF antagonist [Collimonas sp. OK242]|uniref:phosphotransferase enzyme family protein n=1 Tax=Collimonas sp. OK242 TaxID=1798195 RepID=UPI0008941D14|nr:phosphotransferase [Collimonas sp. OK242]SDY29238.1 Ser/Thr protein kinase RdoA involved in Cpx stress response, MazF antagonist [Collimonas sp. OK242]
MSDPRQDDAIGPGMPAVLSHGMGLDAVASSWPALTLDEVARLLRHYPQVGTVARLNWHSPRPFSSACVADTVSGPVFVKRLLRVIRTADELMDEHRFMAHLQQHGMAVSEVLQASDGNTAHADGDWTYEVQRVGQGVDRYRDATSWTPFASTADAAAAGGALARLHLAARGYDAPARSTKLLASGFTLFNIEDPQGVLSRIGLYMQERPALADYLAQRDWQQEVGRVLLPFHARLSPMLHGLTPLWTHNDWHASNLLWQPHVPAELSTAVATVVDFGLADRTCAVYDLAIAIERNLIEWLALPSMPVNQRGLVHIDQLDAMLDAYEAVRPLSVLEAAALPALLPLAHAEFALSELAYFHGVQKSAENSALAYDTYFLGHAEWFNSDAGEYLLDHLQRRSNHKNKQQES